MPHSGVPKLLTQRKITRALQRTMLGLSGAAILFCTFDPIGLGLNATAALQQPSRQRSAMPRQALTTDEFGDVIDAAPIQRDDCGYLQNPENPREAMARHRALLSDVTQRIARSSASSGMTELADPNTITRKNFIDDILFGRMAQDRVQSASLCTDEEFVRRIYLDLTGRIPAADDITTFLASTNPAKREALIDTLIGSPEYVDKWTMFFGDLFQNNARSTNINRFTGGRDAYYSYIKNSLAANKSYKQMATEMLTAGSSATADNFVTGEANFIVGGHVPMGPAQDAMDGRAVHTASMFLGIKSLDCLLCHDGAGHLDTVNLWGSQKTRADAWGMSAFFARVNMARQTLSSTPLYIKHLISERNTGEYQLNTNTGNRQIRSPINGNSTVTPKYILGGGGVNTGENRRQALARLLTADKQFARAAVNYIWEKLMVEALVSPSNSFDPARLDANAQLPTGWSVQPANPALLEALANDFIANNYNIQKLIATIVKSSAYQLSAQYAGTWNQTLVPYYARKFVRRLDAEEIHDAILKATGISVTYQLRDNLNVNTWAVNWAMQLPDTVEPRGNANAQQFLNSFIRGDRDVKPRSLEPSILQALNLMNNTFVMNRIHNANAGSTVQTLLANSALSSQEIITQLYLKTLSRYPTTSELGTLTPLFSSLGRTEAAQTVQWALLNKMDFIFNY